ncbi:MULTISPECIES: VOC family protein [Bacillus]|uniref:VOC family protein n=1 Tax=Bacillus TaxID=1386 RepID=UPI0002D85A23|nr:MULTISPECIES: VOC family protein [Bacillus]
MSFAFDHLVHFVEEPKDAIAQLKENGIYAAEGGVHQNRGTYNALSYFDLSYIEFLSTYDRELVKKTQHPAHSLVGTIVQDDFIEGFSRIAIRTTDIEKDAQFFRDKGLTVNGPVSMNRKRPDNSVIDWQLLYVGDENGELELPFIIQWNESDEERRADLIEREVITTHPSGVSFSHVNFAVRDLQSTVKKWSELLGLPAGEEYMDEELQATSQALHLPGGNLVFSSPIGEGVVSSVLKNRGERPFKVTFAGGINNSTFSFLGGIYKIEKK